MAINFTSEDRKCFQRMFNNFFEDRRSKTQDFFNKLKTEAENRNYEPLTTFVKNAGEIYKNLEDSTRKDLNFCAAETIPPELRSLSGGDEFERNFTKAFKNAIEPMDSKVVISPPVITSGEAVMDKEIFDEIRETIKKYQKSMQDLEDALEKELKRYDGNTLSHLFAPIKRIMISRHTDFCTQFETAFRRFESIYSSLPNHIQTGSTGQTGQGPGLLDNNQQPSSNQNPNGQPLNTNPDPQRGIEFKIEKFKGYILRLREGTVDERFYALQELTRKISDEVPSGSMLTPESQPEAVKTANAYKYALENIAPFVVRESGATSRHEEWKKGPNGKKSTEELVKDIIGTQEPQPKFDNWKYYSQHIEALKIVTNTDFQKFGAAFALLKRNLAEGTVLSSGNHRFSRNDKSQWKNTGKDMGLLIAKMVRFSGLLLGDNVDCWWLNEYETLQYEEEPIIDTMADKRAAANARLLLEKYRRERSSFKSLYKKAWEDFRFGISIGQKATKAVTSLIRMGCLMVNPIGYVAVDAVLKAVEKSVDIASAAGSESIAGIVKVGVESTEMTEQIENAIGDADDKVRDKVIDLLHSKSLGRIRDISDTLIAKDTKVSDAVKMAKEFMEPLVSEGLLQLSDVQMIEKALGMISGVKETINNYVAPVTEKVGEILNKAKQAISPAPDELSEILLDEDAIPNWMERWFREAPEKCRKYRGYDGLWDDVRAYIDMAGDEFRELETCICNCRAKVPGWTQDAQLDVESAYLGVYIKEKQNGAAMPDKCEVAERCRSLLKSMGYMVERGQLQRCLNALD